MKTRKEKINFLKGILNGTNSIDELKKEPFRIFYKLNNQADYFENNLHEQYTNEYIQKIKKNQSGTNNYIIVQASTMEAIKAVMAIV